MDSLSIAVRPANESDVAFIFATWLKCYHRSCVPTRRIPAPIFFRNHHKIVERILQREGVVVTVAHPPEEPDLILGYLVVEYVGGGPVIHFSFTKDAFRKLGVLRRLLVNASVDLNRAQFTHWTYACNTFIEKFPGLSYNPYMQ